MDINLANKSIRRDDWKHTSTAPVQKQAKRVPLSAINEKPVDFEFTPAVKPEVHPLRMPATMAPTQVDWMNGREYQDRKTGNVRLVSAAEVDEIVSWAIPRIKLRYPRATVHSLTSFLKQACRNSQFKFVRTNTACGLFCYEQTVWEPQPIVFEKFVLAREPTMMAMDVRRIYSAAMAWAQEIKAVEFQYGGSTGIDITPIARKIGYENRRYEFYKRLEPNDTGARR